MKVKVEPDSDSEADETGRAAWSGGCGGGRRTGQRKCWERFIHIVFLVGGIVCLFIIFLYFPNCR